jgi:hypothetical protein
VVCGATCPDSNNCSPTFPLNFLFRVSVWPGQAWADFCSPEATYSEGFWRWCDAFRRILLLDFIHHPMFFFKKQRFGSWLCFRLQVKRGRGEGVAPTLWGHYKELVSITGRCIKTKSKILQKILLILI